MYALTDIDVSMSEKDGGAGISIWDITPQIRQILADSEVENGFVNVISRHTTTGYSD